MKAFRLCAATSAAVLAAACGIGDGNKLETLSLAPASITTSTAHVESSKVYRCIRDQLRAYGTFGNGEVGDYTSRGRWTSLNPEIVKVSNGQLPEDAVPDDPTGLNVFIPGTLTPVSPGTATVQFDYVGLTKTIEITVEDLPDDAFSIEPGDLSIAPKSFQNLNLKAQVEEDRELDITATARWSFVEEDEDVAELTATTGVVEGKAVGGPLTAQASLSACGLAPTATVTVKPIQALTLEREYESDRLVVGTSEKLTVTADFGDGTEQDLSIQASYCVAPEGFIAFFVTSNIRNYISAQNAGSAGVLAIFPPFSSFDLTDSEDDNFSCAEPPPADQIEQTDAMAFTAVAATLCSIDVVAAPPADPKNATIEFGTTQQFNAIGTFTTATIDANNPSSAACANQASLIVQDITRHVTFSSSDTTKAVAISASQSFLAAGIATGVDDEGGTVTITAVAASPLVAAVQQVTDANKATLTVTPQD